MDGRRAGSYRLLRLATLDAERQRLIQMRDGDEISDGVLHRVERDLDLEQALLTGLDGSQTNGTVVRIPRTTHG